MKLPDPNIQTGPWEQVRDGVQHNFDALASALIDTGGKSIGIRVGTQSLTWTGAVKNSSVVSVSHGLGRVPVVVVATAKDAPQTIVGQVPMINVFGYAAATFSIDAELDVAFTGSMTVAWIAIG